MTFGVGRSSWNVGAGNREDLAVGRQVRDTHGRPAGDSTEHTLPSVLVAPSSSTENLDGGELVTTRRWCSAAAGADVRADDRIRRPSDPPAATSALRDRYPWQVVGDPSAWTPGTVFVIERSP